MKLFFAGIFLILALSAGTGAWLVMNSEDLPSQTVQPTLDSAQPSATLEIFSPPVWILPNGLPEKREASPGESVTAGTRIMTGQGGRAQLLYPNKSVTRLDSDTEAVLSVLSDNPVRISVRLEKNRIWSRVVRLLGKDSYETVTNTMIASVRGTSYGHGILQGGTNKITTTRGTIDSACINAAHDVLVPRDRKIFLTCDLDESLETLPVDESDKDGWFAFNAAEDRKLEERFGAETYGDASASGVLGQSADALPATPTPLPTPELVTCTGIDGKISRVTREVCDSVNAFWKTRLFVPTPTARAAAPTAVPPTLTPVPALSPVIPFTNLFTVPNLRVLTPTPTLPVIR